MISDESSLIHVMPLHKDEESKLFRWEDLGSLYTREFGGRVILGSCGYRFWLQKAVSTRMIRGNVQSKSTNSGSSFFADVDADW